MPRAFGGNGGLLLGLPKPKRSVEDRARYCAAPRGTHGPEFRGGGVRITSGARDGDDVSGVCCSLLRYCNLYLYAVQEKTTTTGGVQQDRAQSTQQLKLSYCIVINIHVQ